MRPESRDTKRGRPLWEGPAWWFGRACWLGEDQVHAGLAHVAAGLVLVAVVDHEQDPVGVPGRDRVPVLVLQAGEVPAHFGPVFLVADARGRCVRAGTVGAVLRRIGARCDRRARLDRSLPGAEQVVRALSVVVVVL